VLRFERGIQDGAQAAARKHLQWRVFWQLAAATSAFCAMFVALSLAKSRWGAIEYCALALGASSLAVLVVTDARESEAKYVARANAVLKDFGVHFDGKGLYQLSPFRIPSQGATTTTTAAASATTTRRMTSSSPAAARR
jgi:hypothetical protein